MKNRPYQDVLYDLYDGYNMDNVKLITFQITDACDCRCTYCYQTNKSNNFMSKNTAKNCVDFLFKMYDENDENSYINKNTKAIIFEFIGGEPLLAIDTIDYICSYFFESCIERYLDDWLLTFRISMISNGQNYFDERVQSFIKKWNDYLSFSITVDGPKEMHDKCRITKNGEGTFDKAFSAITHYYKKYQNGNTGSTKVTISEDNLDNLDTIFNFFMENNISVWANPVYERNWTIEDGKKYYEKLKILADAFLEPKNKNFDTSLFEENFFKPLSPEDNRNWCGGTGMMLCFDPNGDIYPCLRYMDSSLNGEREPLLIGNCTTGIYNTEKAIQIRDKLKSITRRSQSSDKCFNCPIASGCPWCSAWNYQETGDVNNRVTNICNMHKARSLANAYYWNKYYKKNKINKHFDINLPKEECLKFISEDEYNSIK